MKDLKENTIKELPVGELLEMKFFIPSYQRGYRWTEQEVKDLLSDIDEFTPKEVKDSNEKTWYCLQPIVVKECNEATKSQNNLDGTWYEVIDGQQRLTTIFLIIHYANEMWIRKQKTSEFQLKYETRDKSTEFLHQLKVNESTKEVEIDDKAKSNIDFFHISRAYDAINRWVNNYGNFDTYKFMCKLKSFSKVIWYEISFEKDSIEIFTRLNMGKIQLTNSELIKALFLNSSNFQNSETDFQNSGTEKIRLKQMQIAYEWDRIEYTLQNDEFWYFINKGNNEVSTRIEFIFNLIEKISGSPIERGRYSIFRFFSDKFKLHNEKEIVKNWEEIKTLFQTLEEWFANRVLYHKIGYLNCLGTTDIKDLVIESKKKTKTEFISYLDNSIDGKIACKDLSSLSYKGNYELIKNILLLHNIQTMLNNKDETSRFPFDKYKKEKWDIEHIHAIATEMPTNKPHRIDWLNYALEFIDKNEKMENSDKILHSEIEYFVRNYDEHIKIDDGFEDISEIILNYFSKQGNKGKMHEDVNDISNLVLLDSGTNRAYKNAIFPVKRKTIIEKEKTGTFIPICTRNVFLKYYNWDVSQMTFWDNEKDGKTYLDDIQKTLFTKSY